MDGWWTLRIGGNGIPETTYSSRLRQVSGTLQETVSALHACPRQRIRRGIECWRVGASLVSLFIVQTRTDGVSSLARSSDQVPLLHCIPHLHCDQT